MLKKLLAAAAAVAIIAFFALAFMPAPGLAGSGNKACGITGSCDGENYQVTCMNWIDPECESAAQCDPCGHGGPGQPGG